MKNKEFAALLALIPGCPFHLVYLGRSAAQVKALLFTFCTCGIGGLGLNFIESLHLLFMSEKDFFDLYCTGKKDDGKFVCEALNKKPRGEMLKELVKEGMAAAKVGDWVTVEDKLGQAFLVDAQAAEKPEVRGAYVDGLASIGNTGDAERFVLEQLTAVPEKTVATPETPRGKAVFDEVTKRVKENREELSRRVPITPLVADVEKEYAADWKLFQRKRENRKTLLIVVPLVLGFLFFGMLGGILDLPKGGQMRATKAFLETPADPIEAKLQKEEAWRKLDEQMQEEYRQILIKTGWLPGQNKPPALITWEKKRDILYDRHIEEVMKDSGQESNRGTD